MLGLKLNHVSKRGHWWSNLVAFPWLFKLCTQNLTLVKVMACHLFGAKPFTWTNSDLLSITLLATNVNDFLIKIQLFSFKKMHLKVSAKCQPFCLNLSVLVYTVIHYSMPWHTGMSSKAWHQCIVISTVHGWEHGNQDLMRLRQNGRCTLKF